MVQVTVATTTSRNTVIVDDQTTIKEVLEDVGSYMVGNTYHLNGSPLTEDDLTDTLAQLHAGSSCTIVAVPIQKAGSR